MTDEEKNAFETLKQSFVKMETLYKIKCHEVQTKQEEITRLTEENEQLTRSYEKLKQDFFDIKNQISYKVQYDYLKRKYFIVRKLNCDCVFVGEYETYKQANSKVEEINNGDGLESENKRLTSENYRLSKEIAKDIIKIVDSYLGTDPICRRIAEKYGLEYSIKQYGGMK